MAHPIDAVPNHTFKKGDKVQHLGTGWFATVTEDQIDPEIIKINWDVKPEGPQAYMVRAFRVAPWHGVATAHDDELAVHLKNFSEAGLIDRPVSGSTYRGPAEVRLADIDINRIADGKIRLRLYDRDNNAVSITEDDAVKMQEFALRLIQQTTYVLADLTKR